jgi:hypothetical protein
VAVEALFLTSSDLARGVSDTRVMAGFREARDLAVQLELPFGLDALMWRRILDQIDVVSGALEADEAGEYDDEQLREEATRLREVLHPLV